MGFLRRRRDPRPGSLSEEGVVWAYRLFLDRDPESREVVAETLRAHRTPADLRRTIMDSPEFRVHALGDRFAGLSAVAIAPLDDLRVFVDLTDTVSGIGLVTGTGEVRERDFVKAHLTTGDVALDLGANVGLFTATMGQAVGPTGTVVAFEPLPQARELLHRTIKENGFEGRVRVEQHAVADRNRTTRIVVSPGGYLSSSALLRAAMTDPEALEVQTIRLDDVDLPRPVRLIKADVEGAELMAFRGAEGLLRKDRPLVIAEINRARLKDVSGASPEDLIAFLTRLGYRGETIDGRDLQAAEVEHVETGVFRPT